MLTDGTQLASAKIVLSNALSLAEKTMSQPLKQDEFDHTEVWMKALRQALNILTKNSQEKKHGFQFHQSHHRLSTRCQDCRDGQLFPRYRSEQFSGHGSVSTIDGRMVRSGIPAEHDYQDSPRYFTGNSSKNVAQALAQVALFTAQEGDAEATLAILAPMLKRSNDSSIACYQEQVARLIFSLCQNRLEQYPKALLILESDQSNVGKLFSAFTYLLSGKPNKASQKLEGSVIAPCSSFYPLYQQLTRELNNG